MPKRIHKYDRGNYPAILSHSDRRLRKAFFYVERLAEISPGFRDSMKGIRASLRSRKITQQEADKQTSDAMLKAMGST